MYYSYSCSYCKKTFYTFNDSRDQAAKTLYDGIISHLKAYGEEDKEHEMNDGASRDISQIYSEISESEDTPAGGYEL